MEPGGKATPNAVNVYVMQLHQKASSFFSSNHRNFCWLLALGQAACDPDEIGQVCQDEIYFDMKKDEISLVTAVSG